MAERDIMLHYIRCTSVYSRCVIFDVDFLDENLEFKLYGKANVIVRKLTDEKTYDTLITITSPKKYRNSIKKMIDEVDDECIELTKFIFQEDNNIIPK